MIKYNKSNVKWGEGIKSRIFFMKKVFGTLLVLIGVVIFFAALYVLVKPEITFSSSDVDFFRIMFVYVGVVLLFLVVVNVILQKRITKISNDRIRFLESSEKVELDEIISQLPLGIIRLAEASDEIILVSEQVVTFFGRDIKGEMLSQVHASFESEHGFTIPEEFEVNDFVVKVIFDSKTQTLKMLDVTEVRRLEKELYGKQAVAGFITVDNFDVTLGKSETEPEELSFMLNKTLNQWFNERGVYIRQYREDRWFVATENNKLKILEEERFTILEKVRSLGKKLNLQLSISGAFSSADDFWSASKISWPLIDLIENRGGDQIVVRNSEGELQTYGGLTKIDAQRTQTKARAMTSLFTDVLKEADKIYIMGHKFADADVIGATLGMKRFCEHNGLEATIILNWEDVNPEVKRLYLELNGDPMLFVAPESFSLEEVQGKLAKVIMVDTTVQALVEIPELLDVCDVIALDHHRRGINSFSNISVSYVEPYASSTAELVTEMLQYAPESIMLSLSDATMLFYGIVVDSQNFKIKTGKATFAAASYLRDKGADPVLLHEITRESFQVFVMRNKLLSYAMNIQGNKMLSVSTEEATFFRREELAKAAETLLEFSDVEVAIVAGKLDSETIGVSARSMGEVNVQVLMEQFGGGGHFTAAATQLKDTSLEKVKLQLEQALRRI